MKTGPAAKAAPAEEEGAGEEKVEEGLPEWFREGMARDALFRGDLSGLKMLSRGMGEEEIEREEAAVKAWTKDSVDWVTADLSRLFRKDYNVIRSRGASSILICTPRPLFINQRSLANFHIAQNNWNDVHPNLKDLPPKWPGVGLAHGLRDEHLVPNCKCFPTLKKLPF